MKYCSKLLSSLCPVLVLICGYCTWWFCFCFCFCGTAPGAWWNIAMMLGWQAYGGGIELGLPVCKAYVQPVSFSPVLGGKGPFSLCLINKNSLCKEEHFTVTWKLYEIWKWRQGISNNSTLAHFSWIYGCKSVHLQVNLGSTQKCLMDTERPGTQGKYIFIKFCSLLVRMALSCLIKFL